MHQFDINAYSKVPNRPGKFTLANDRLLARSIGTGLLSCVDTPQYLAIQPTIQLNRHRASRNGRDIFLADGAAIPYKTTARFFLDTSTLGTGMSLRLSDKHELPLSAVRNNLAAELDDELRAVLNAWFPRCVDTKNGGFRCDFNHRWKPCGPQLRMLEYQARVTRTAAGVAMLPGFESYRDIADHGFRYLKDIMWDHEYGGWFRLLDPTGVALEAGSKHTHGASYALGACTAYYKLTANRDALDLAKQAFAWLDNAAHDPQHGGYFGLCQRSGKPILTVDQNPRGGVRDAMGIPIGLKDANTNGDMLQAIDAIHDVWPDALVKERLRELFYIGRDRMFVPPGALHEYFQPDWTPIPDVTRYGHAAQRVNYLAQASSSLGLDNDPKTQSVLKSVVDNLLRYAWDDPKGGFFCAGSAFGPTSFDHVRVFVPAKIWWTQAEGLRALLRMAIMYPEDEADYSRRFEELWAYIKKYLIDSRRGGWRWIGLDCAGFSKLPKAQLWKDLSHEVESLLYCMQLLKS
jgi:cellobiose epimerase